MRALKEQELSAYLKEKGNLREFSCERDFEKLKSLLTDEWNLGRRYSGVSREYAGKVYATLILSCSNYLFTLLDEEDNPIGFVGLENKELNEEEPFKSKSIAYKAEFDKLISEEYVGNNGLEIYYSDESLIEETQRALYKNLLSILIVDKDYKGNEYGRFLVNSIKELMTLCGANEDEVLSIYTTDKCNVEFYRLLGAEEVERIESKFEKDIQYLFPLK